MEVRRRTKGQAPANSDAGGGSNLGNDEKSVKGNNK